MKKKNAEVKVEENLFDEQNTVGGITASEPAPAEKEVPAPKKRVSKKSAPKKEEAPKKPAPKKETEKPVEKSLKKVSKKSAPAKEAPAQSKRDKMFPATLDVEGTILHRWDVADWSTFKTEAEKVITAGGSVYLAVSWPKKFRKDYDGAYAPAKMPKDGFPFDLDLEELMMFQQTINRGLMTSVYTEALSVVYDTDINRDSEGYFVINGAEADLYIVQS